jgi:hypothetical protein
MYVHCLWCQRELGSNEVIEAFPVGRRLAFDAAKGRLWVVCPACERWNLTPTEERWEAIESCEQLYRDTRKRASTGEIGLARARDGLELVRIGAPLRPEFAAWRYGDQFGRRRLRSMALVSAGVAAAGAAVAGMVALGGGLFLGSGMWSFGRDIALRSRTATVLNFNGRRERVSMLLADRTRIQRTGDVLRLAIPRTTSATTADTPPDLGSQLSLDAPAVRPYSMPVGFAKGDWDLVEGAVARDVLARLLPAVNRAGGTKADIADAVRRSERMDGDRATMALRGVSGRVKPLHDLDVTTRLMLEMALHEDDERRWMEGELADLDARWREAEALAAIADQLPGSGPR